ncbi:hypothetical protein ABIB57_003618 [Devosia sp. UYZn731]|uniref:hypothetical protein n=1 Tax=Devosia sp. UYZn731 TaxID=3156345 RepID=UPI00339A8991
MGNSIDVGALSSLNQRGDDVAGRLILVYEDEADFLKEAIETWHTLNRGNLSDEAYAKRGARFNLIRHLDGKYTEAERQEIARVALGLLD